MPLVFLLYLTVSTAQPLTFSVCEFVSLSVSQSVRMSAVLALQTEVDPRALEYFRKGEALIGTAKEYSEEQQLYFAKAVEIAPAFAPARHNLGLVYLKRGKLDEALVQLQELLKLDPKNVSARLLCADIWAQKQDLDRAAEELEQVLEIQPDKLDVIEQLGNIRVRQKRFAEAVPLLQKAASGPESGPDVHFNLGLAFENLGRKDDSLSSYLLFLQQVPDDPQANLAAGLLLKDKGDKQGAVRHLLKAYSPTEPDPAIAEELGNLYLDLGKEEEARKYLAQANTDSPVTLANLGIAAKRQKQYPQAEAQFRAALAKDAANADIWAHLADVLAAQKKDDEALQAYQKALDLKPGDFDNLFNLGSVYANLGRNPEAQKAFEQALKVDPKSGRNHLYLAVVLDRQDQGTAARNHYLSALANGADEPQAHFRLAILYSRERNVDEALKHLAVAFERQADKYLPMVLDELKNIHSDLDAIRYTKAFADLMAKYERR
ncbi:MAG: tetratricopeptide repeat protein [Acidobacteria bacterium]|nr:MAG: tetratricopeptide repeat protein [Acidobacteriota bacterium]